jgi:hypothetical protein
MTVLPLPVLLGLLPKRFQWTVHNLIAHPLSEVLFQLGLHRWSEAVHDGTAPAGG